MAEETVSERSHLLRGARCAPQYADLNLFFERKRRVKQFQCCLVGIFLSFIIVALLLMLIFTIKSADDNLTPENSTEILPNSTFPDQVLLQLFSKSSWPLKDSPVILDNKTHFEDSLKTALQEGQKTLNQKETIETEAPSLDMESPSYRHQKVVATSDKARSMAKIGYLEEYATRHLYRSKNNSDLVPKICVNSTISNPEFCQNKNISHCNQFHVYRDFNGFCNNLENPFGRSYIPFRRALPPDYADGISKPRRAKDGSRLPSARTVSLIVHRPYYKDDQKFSVMLAVWGQFLDHDITATALSQKPDGGTISCCNSKTLSPECFPVFLDSQDPFRMYNISCMEFVRSAAAPTCCLGPREQLNQATAFIDGSVVYSSDEATCKQLRNLNNGTLKMYITEDNRSLLPLSEDPNDGCNRKEQNKQGRYCFMTGDSRANENLHLTSMHLIWARQHNYLASQLKDLNPEWDDEKLFQESRKILAAQMQHITYNEFLPIIFGQKLMRKFDLEPKRSGYFKGYNKSVDPSIANNFAAAAFRFAHTIIPGLMKFLANDTSSPEYVQMHKMLFEPFKLYQPGELERALRGAMDTNIEATDSYFTNELKEHLFERSSETKKAPNLCGLDLVSLNIQRGRDHGLPGYTKFRNHCGLSNPKSFDDLKNIIDGNSLSNIKKIYKHVEDIDFYTGALSEVPISGSIVGPTITCLLLDQFIRLKFGDRFWYENPTVQGFTKEQLKEIRKTSLAGVICDNSDNLEYAQPRVMEKVRGKSNQLISCEEIPKPDLKYWKENMEHVSMHAHFIEVIGKNNNNSDKIINSINNKTSL